MEDAKWYFTHETEEDRLWYRIFFAMCRKFGVSWQTINAIENNKYDPTLTLAFHLAGVLGTTVDELFLGPGEKSC